MDCSPLPGPMFATRDEIASKEAFDFNMRFLDRSHDDGFDGVAVNYHYASRPPAQTLHRSRWPVTSWLNTQIST